VAGGGGITVVNTEHMERGTGEQICHEEAAASSNDGKHVMGGVEAGKASS